MYCVVPGNQVLHAPQRARDHTNQTGDRVLHGVVLIAHQLLDELEVLVLLDQQDVVPDELVDQILPQLGRDLQRVHPQG